MTTKMLHKVEALTKDISFEECFSLPYNTAKGLRTHGATSSPKRGTSNHTTNNRYSIYSFMKFYRMSNIYYRISGAFSIFQTEEELYSHLNTLSVEERAKIEDEILIYKALVFHTSLLQAFFNSTSGRVSLDTNSQVIAGEFIVMIQAYMNDDNFSIVAGDLKTELENLHISEYSLDILLTDASYIHFLLLFMRFNGQSSS